MRTVEPRNCNAFDQDDEKKGWSHGHFVHQTDDVVTAVGARWQCAEIADDQHAENEQRTVPAEDVGKFIAQTGDDRFETAELNPRSRDASMRGKETLTVLSMPRVMTMKKKRIAHRVDQFISAIVCG